MCYLMLLDLWAYFACKHHHHVPSHIWMHFCFLPFQIRVVNAFRMGIDTHLESGQLAGNPSLQSVVSQLQAKRLSLMHGNPGSVSRQHVSPPESDSAAASVSSPTGGSASATAVTPVWCHHFISTLRVCINWLQFPLNPLQWSREYRASCNFYVEFGVGKFRCPHRL